MKAPPRNIAEGTAEQKGSSPCSLFELDNANMYSTICGSFLCFTNTICIHIISIIPFLEVSFSHFFPADYVQEAYDLSHCNLINSLLCRTNPAC